MSSPLGFSSLFRRAFSILELVSVLVIIGILSGLGAYGYSNFIAVAEQKTERARVETSVRASTAGVITDLPGGRMAMFDSDATSTVLPAFASIMGTHGFTVVWDTTPDDGVVGVASDDFDWDLGLVDGRVVVAAGEEQAMSSTLSFVTPSATYGAYFMNMGTFYDVAWGHTNDVSTYPAGSYIEISYQVVADSGVLVSNSGASTHTVTFTGLSSGVSALGSTSIPFSTQLAMAAGASSLVDTSGAAAIDVAAATQTSDWLVLAGTATLYDATDAVLATDPNFYEVVTLDSAGSGSQFQGIAHGPTVGIYSDWASRAGNVTLYTSWLPNTSAGFKQLYEVELTDGFEGPVVFSEVIDIEALGFDGTSRSLAIDTGVAAATAVSNNWDLYSQGRHCIVP
ncbi:MAG: type II secretion system protein, partial [Fuerstiella sp.]|nr:type II secretion system protein [Fuerstiella sp.]